MTEPNTIAVVGLAGRFPEAPGLDQFWNNLVHGRECMTDLSEEDVLDRGETPDRLRHPRYVLRRPLLPDMEDFDAELFGMTPRDTELRDPQHRIFLEVCHSALEHAGYDSTRYSGAIGVYAGINENGYVDLHLRRTSGLVDAVGELTLVTSNQPDYVSTFTSYKLDLHGPSMTIGTACSSSLVAVHQACQALRTGDCDMALAGGVEVEWPYGVGYIHNPGGIYPSDGYCRPFDADAEGTVFGSGAGAVLLKRYADAVADGDTVYGLVLGSAVNNDGADKVGFSAPSVTGQSACVAEAIADAEVDPRSISYVEAHGTATRLGDPIEVTALARAFRAAAGADLPTGYCGIGSVKSNVGHLGPASGVAGLIKTVLALHNETIPPSINFSSPNPALHLEQTPFSVVGETREWRRSDVPRHAGVSSFGIGGTNAHVVLREAPAVRRVEHSGPELLLVSARTGTALATLRSDLARHLAWRATSTADVAHTLRVGRRALPKRRAVVARDVQDAVTGLTTVPEADVTPVSGVALAFPGQGSQSIGMAHGSYAAVPEFRTRLDSVLTDLSDLMGRDLLALWRTAEDPDELAATDVAQPLLFAVEYALADTMRAMELPIAAVLGHSLGELVAGVVAGVFSRDAGIELVAERARLMRRMPPGAMAAVAATAQDLADSLTDRVTVAAINTASQVVLSGPEQALLAALDRLRLQGIESRRLPTSHAYHSDLMHEAVPEFRIAVAKVERDHPTIPFLSCASGRFETQRATDPDFWARQLVEPVLFAAAANELIHHHDQVLVLETGPGTTLTEFFRALPAVRRGRASARAALGKPPADHVTWLRTLGHLWEAGIDLDVTPLSPDSARRVAVPGYPYERRRYFIDHPPANSRQVEPERTDVPAAAPAVPETARAPRLCEVTWARAPRTLPRLAAPGSRDALVLLPEDPGWARSILAVVQRAGLRPRRVRVTGTPKTDPTPDLTLDPTDRAQVFALLEALATAGELPDTVVHAAAVTPGAEEAHALTSWYWLAQAVQRFRGAAGHQQLRLVALTRHGVDVTGSEPMTPANAMPAALLRTIHLEDPTVRCQVLDVGDRFDTDTAAAALCDDELSVAAVRGSDLWLPAVRAVPAPGTSGTRLRRRGVYLITGGLGALGRMAAHALADSGVEPRLVLIGRSVPDNQSFRDELTACGAEVELIAADVADEEQLRAALARVHRTFGHVNGVLHAAGVAGDGLVELRTEDQVDAVLRAKAVGGRVLHRVLAEEPALDFVVHYGSRAALTGLVGSGDYAAANAYLVGLSSAMAGGGRHVVTVSWPGWAEAGMAVRDSVPDPGSPHDTVVEETWDGSEWFVDEHRIAGEPVLPGTGYVDLILTRALDAGLVTADQPIQLTDMVFTAPLRVGPDTTVRVTFRPRRSGFAVTVRSRTGGQAEWSEHGQAVVANGPAEPANVDLDDLYRRAAASEQLPPELKALVVTLGPRWPIVRSIARVDDDLVGELVLRDEFLCDLDRHRAHPAVLDTALSMVRAGRTIPYLPFHYREAVFFRTVPAEVVVVVRDIRASGRNLHCGVTLYDRRGREVARVTGLTMREVEPSALLATPSDDATSPLLSPAEGTALLRQVIDTPGPTSLTVLRPGEPLPGHVMLAADATEPAPVPVAAAQPAGPPEPAGRTPAPPDLATSVEHRLGQLWEQLIGIADIGQDEDFFDIGGNSLAAVQLVARIHETFGVQLSVGAIFEEGTIRQLAGAIDRDPSRRP